LIGLKRFQKGTLVGVTGGHSKLTSEHKDYTYTVAGTDVRAAFFDHGIFPMKNFLWGLSTAAE